MLTLLLINMIIKHFYMNVSTLCTISSQINTDISGICVGNCLHHDTP